MCVFGTPFGGKGGRIGQRWYHSKERWWFPIGSLHCDRCGICNHSATICHRMSPTPKSTEDGLGHFGAKCGEEELTDVSQTVAWSGRDKGLFYAWEFASISSAVWAQCTNVSDRHTNRHIGWHDRSWTISISSITLLLTVTSNNFISPGRYIQWNSSCKILVS